MKNSESGKNRSRFYFLIIVVLLSLFLSCATSPSLFGLAIFPTSVDFNELRAGISQEEFERAGVVPNKKHSIFLGSYNFSTKEWIGRDLETWTFKNSRYTRQFLYFEESLLVGWEELPVQPEDTDVFYTGGWKDWPRDYD